MKYALNTVIDLSNEESTEYLVLAILFKMGVENKFINEFINKIPKKEYGEAALKAGTVKLSDLLSDKPENELNECYHYQGSLTTPPYTESVTWYVSKHIYKASAEQIQRINKIEGNNARHVQALYGRTIEEE